MLPARNFYTKEMSAYAFASRVEDASEEAVVAEAVAVDDFESNTFAITTAGTTSPAIAATNVSYEHQATISATTSTAVVVPTMNMTNNGSSSVDGAQLEPICESFPDPREIRIVIELFENERYSPRLGFSSRGLLINDRGIYSNDDGSMR